MIRAGELRERVSILTYFPSDSGPWGDQGNVTCWDAVAEVWASVTQLSATEKAEAGQVRTHDTFDVVMRYNPLVSQTSRLRWRDKTLEVLALVDPDSRQLELRITAGEVPHDR